MADHGAFLLDCQNKDSCRNILNCCEKALKYLHSFGLCHGDFRPSNILVCKDNSIRIIDFDWAGEAGVAKYPSFMNHSEIKWPP